MYKSHFKNNQAKRTAYLLFLVFIVPVIIAYSLYAYRDRFTFTTTENGTLLSPPVYTAHLPFFNHTSLGKWQLIYVTPHNCDTHCQTISSQFQQIIAALGKDKLKVVSHSISTSNSTLLTRDTIAIIDPKGWLIMYYSSSTDPQAILKDIKRLLRYSHA